MDDRRDVVFSCDHECDDRDLSVIELLEGDMLLCPTCYKLAVGSVVQSILAQALHEHMQANLKFEI